MLFVTRIKCSEKRNYLLFKDVVGILKICLSVIVISKLSQRNMPAMLQTEI